MKLSAVQYGAPAGQSEEQAMFEILDALATQQDLVSEKWDALTAELAILDSTSDLDAGSRTSIANRRLLMERELSRYQRFLQALRQGLIRTGNRRRCFA